jgi:hypothetical protein
VISLIQQDPTFKKITLDDVIGKIINHEMLVEEAQHVKNLSKGTISPRKQDIAFKASKNSKSKKVVEESSSEEEDDDSDDESTGYDPKEMALFVIRFTKMMGKQKFFKEDKKDKFKSKTKRACYNCGKYDHYIANYPYERREEEDDKKKKKKRKKNEKSYKKKTYGEAHIGKEWDSDDESSNSDSDGVVTVAIKGSSSSSSRSLFPNINKGKHTCIMAKESKRKVKSKSSPPKYVSSDDELDSSDENEETLLNAMCKNPKERIRGLLKEVGMHDELLDQ